MKNTIAIIPARSGSKGVKNKNIKLLKGKPLIGWAIECCAKSKLFSKIYVSTDSKKYAKIAKKFGAVEIILRPKKFSKDNSTDYEMINHAIESIKINYDFIAHIRPTSPLRQIFQLKNALKIFKNSNYTSLRSVHEMQETSYKTFEINSGNLKPLRNTKMTIDQLNGPRQSFPKTFVPNGIIDIYKKKFVLSNKSLFGKKTKAYITPLTHEIDTIEDFKYIEFLWQK
tara:strand:- start:123 stop:803 length:681 start_codon:yes stop_codon:yes gene_type:complete